MNHSIIIFKNSDGDLMFNYSTTSFINVNQLFATLTFSIPKDNKDTEYQNRILKAMIALCKLRRGVRGNFITKMLLENFYSDEEHFMQCPVPPGTGNIWNFKLADSYIPSYLLISDLKYAVDFVVRAKISKSKPLVYMYSVRFIGEIKKWLVRKSLQITKLFQYC